VPSSASITEVPAIVHRDDGVEGRGIRREYGADRGALESREQVARRAREPRRVRAHGDRDVCAALREHARGDEAIAAIVAVPGQHQHAHRQCPTETCFECVRDPAARALHQGRDGGARRDRGLIDGAHLGGRQEMHRDLSDADRAPAHRS
jgi:hypothetical protein